MKTKLFALAGAAVIALGGSAFAQSYPAGNIDYIVPYPPGGGTDAGRFHLSGIGMPAIALTVPVRYLHTNVSIIHKDDYEAAVQLVVALTKRLDHETVQWLKEG